MPNYVYSTITFNTKDVEKIKKILSENNNSLCEWYKPFPQDLKDTTSPARIGENISQEKSDELIEKYGTNNWYDWKKSVYGTKWGDSFTSFNNGILSFSSAWSPISRDIIDKLAESFDFTYEWVEEQGFGEYYKFVDEGVAHYEDWDIPNIDWIDKHDIINLCEEHRGFKVGYYSDDSFEVYLGDNLEDVIKKIN